MKKKVSGKTKTSFIVFLLFSFFILNNCQYFTQLSYEEWRETSGVNNDVDVYICGNYTSGMTSFPCYWKNGDVVILGSYTGGVQSTIESICLDGDDIYCGGAYLNVALTNACYWKNDILIKVELDNQGITSLITSIAVVNGVVFACGREETKACYWINGKKYLLNDSGTGDSYAYSMAVDKDTLDFYITGTYNAGSYTAACYWKNGEECVTLPNPIAGVDAIAKTIAVSNGKVYIGGFYEITSISYPCYWIDGKCVELPYDTSGQVFAISIYGGSVYSVGRNNTFPALWKDNSFVWEDTSISNLSVYCVAIYNKDIYLSGYTSSSTSYFWKNENMSTLYPGSNTRAKCITIKPKR